jgi:hypothetical protein
MEYINYSDKLFVVKRKIKEHHIKTNIDLTPLKVLWHCDTILKKNSLYYFCDSVKDISYEETTN